ncbi:MAG: hypothetical protein ACJ735_06200 [Actinomycetes bacterium]
MPIASARLARRVTADFGSTDEAATLLGEAGDSERVQAAVLLWARGDMTRLREGVSVAQQDWRDALVRAGLAGDDWSEQLDRELGCA